MTKKVRIGVIGTGEFAEVCHLPGLQSHSQARVVALCGRDYERTRSLADRFAVSDVHTDYHDLCAREDIDAVTIVTQNVFHAEQAIVAFKHGKHVLCEKPLGVNVAQAQQMLDAAKMSEKINQVAFTFRYLYSVKALRQRIRAGDIGRPFYIRIQYDGWNGLRPDWETGWRESRELAGGGMLFDLGSHLFDIVRFVFGTVSVAGGFTQTVPRCRWDRHSQTCVNVETDDLAAAWFTQAHGIRGQWFASRITPAFSQNGYLEVVGTEGALKASLSRGKFDELKVSRPTQPDWEDLPLPAEASDGQPHCLTAMMRSFVDACLRGKSDDEVDATFEDGLAVQQCLDAVLRSAESATV